MSQSASPLSKLIFAYISGEKGGSASNVTATGVVLTTTGKTVTGVALVNTDTNPIYARIYDVATSGGATGSPAWSFLVPASSKVLIDIDATLVTTTGVTVSGATTANGTTAPTANTLSIGVEYY